MTGVSLTVSEVEASASGASDLRADLAEGRADGSGSPPSSPAGRADRERRAEAPRGRFEVLEKCTVRLIIDFNK